VLQVTLYRPWHADAFLAALPRTVKAIAVLDRTKEPGALGDPLYLDVLGTFAQAVASGTWGAMPRLIGGRYGLSSKDFDPAMAKAVFDELDKPDSRHGFTVGITDDVSHTSLAVDPGFDIEPPDVVRALFYGLGADGTVGANKNSVKILAADPRRYAQGYFVYDSKKSGSYTISHLRFGPKRVRAPYLLKSASFVGVHKFDFLFKQDVLRRGGARRHGSRQQPVPSRRRVGRVAAQGAATDHRQASAVVRHRRVESCVGPGSRLAQQHHSADVLLCAVRRAAARRSDRRDQAGNRKDVRPQGCGNRQEELRGDRQCARQSARSRGTPRCDRHRMPSRRWCRTRRPPSCATSSP
jgi:hypothetical protein